MAETEDILQYIYNKSSGKITEYPWFEEVLKKNKLVCFFQPIVDGNKKPIAFESFVRAELEDGTMASGGVIMQAGAALHIEHALDKYLHKMAIEDFAKHKLAGRLSINFISGFIQLPAKYLDGLSKTAHKYNLLPGKVILDVSNSEDLKNLGQLAAVAEYCYNEGYEIALDDVKTPAQLADIFAQLTPDYVKIDHDLVSKIGKAEVKNTVVEMIGMAHEHRCKIMVEGIEDEKTFNLLKDLKADFFQGYFFSKPIAAAEIAKNNKLKSAS